MGSLTRASDDMAGANVSKNAQIAVFIQFAELSILRACCQHVLAWLTFSITRCAGPSRTTSAPSWLSRTQVQKVSYDLGILNVRTLAYCLIAWSWLLNTL
jgi:hypothetical protein